MQARAEQGRSRSRRATFPSRVFFAAVVGCLVALAVPLYSHAQIQIPKQSDWTDHGLVITPGSTGAWDWRLGGQISPCACVKKNGTYFLYYIGADGDRSTDGGPRFRSLGVATSSDGVNFTKYSGNPVITHLPHNNEEEGVFSCGATLDDNGEVVLYYEATWAANSTTEAVDGYPALAVSSNGLDFVDHGYVRSIPGYEDSPLGTFKANGTWYVYYLNSQPNSWVLHLLSGPARDNLTESTSVGISSWGGGEPILLSPTTLALFNIAELPEGSIDVWTAPVSAPDQLQSIAQSYTFENFYHATVYLDEETATWFMYYSRGGLQYPDGVALKTAPMVGGEPTTPPPAPTGLEVD